jgi:hypothetical protein
MSDNLSQDPTIMSDEYEVFEPIIIENKTQMAHFMCFYEDLQDTLKARRVEPEDSFLAPRNDAVSGGLEFFVGFNFEDQDINDRIEELIIQYREERKDKIEFTVPDLTGHEKSLTVDTTNYEKPELEDNFKVYFR